MSKNTATMLNRILSNPAWKLLLVMGILAFIACFFIKGKKRAIPIVISVLSLCLFIVSAVISRSAENLIMHQAGTDPEEVVQAVESGDEYILIDREDPEKEITEEEFMNEFGALVSIPEDIEILGYMKDTDMQRGSVFFKKDGLQWDAYVKPVNNCLKINNIYVDENMHEIDCEFDDGQITTVDGVEPELYYYKTLYADGSEAYDFLATWDLEDKGYQIALRSFSETPIHTLPVEIFASDEGKTDGGTVQSIPESKDETIAVMMSVTNVTPIGLTAHFRQYEKREDLHLVYGDTYTLETLNGDTWEEVPRKVEESGNEEEGNIKMPPEGESELQINWKYLYGRLDPGTYRITMTMADWDMDNPSGFIQAYPLKAQFTIDGQDGIVRTYEVTDPDLADEYFEEDKPVTLVKYYEISDGTWKTDEHTYKYRLEITGRMNAAEYDSTFVYLSNKKEISFEQAWKAAGGSSDQNDYFNPAEAVLVAMK